jgi:Fe-S cluster biogenesis protein NfuA
MTLKMSIGHTLLQHFSEIKEVCRLIDGLGQAAS